MNKMKKRIISFSLLLLMVLGITSCKGKQEEKQYLNHDYVMNYKTVGNDGKLMRAATYFIKEEGREMPVGMLCINVNISDLEYLTSTIKKILGIKEEKDIEFKMDNPVEILSSPLDEMIDMYIKECLEKMGFPSYFLAERLNVDEKIKVVKYLQEKGYEDHIISG